ncbi:concanavalin A-like lectin/glucanase domain-containing protein [Chaetomium fimeti]|uniref:Concanavalin A-like lectin/glucanase domain-containing protein n=1 Tax=Chaetomium fimeti TaxID=1854472 RepID=A0AAE0LRU7_9PEZI|nr:concanavalin A-like lectin/glucanase domain-containing protein [Chaetomium fimeti]
MTGRPPSNPSSPTLPLLFFILLLLLHLPPSAWEVFPSARADCECGYLAPSAAANGFRPALFTDLLETDFTRLARTAADNDDDDEEGDGDDDDIWTSGTTGWARQAFNMSRARARGEYGEMFAVGNVGVGEAGLGLVVRSEVVDGMVSVAELDTERLDLRWGTFRAMMKVSRVRGTCAAFFWYFNDTQEIDMEFLSKDFNAANGSYPVNLVLQSREAALAGYDAAKTGNFVRVELPFDPRAGFHEYRIDYLPGQVFFYADGEALAGMDGPAVPSSPGHLILQHWSNGNPRWSGGPPVEDAALVVRYVKAYFNSSLGQRQRDWESRCRDPAAPNAVCEIPDVTPGDMGAADWFFSDHSNMTNNQTTTTTSEESEGSRLKQPWWPTTGCLLLAEKKSNAWIAICSEHPTYPSTKMIRTETQPPQISRLKKVRKWERNNSTS